MEKPIINRISAGERKLFLKEKLKGVELCLRVQIKGGLWGEEKSRAVTRAVQ